MPMIPFVKTGYLGTNQWVPLVNGNGLTAGGGEPVPEITWVKVSGTSPLSLPGAIANSIKSLTQYGLCAQASTPTPDAPVDIVCNNGALRYGAVGKNWFGLNASPTERTYLDSTGSTGTSANWTLSEFIAVNPATQYTFNPNSASGATAKIGYYTAEQTFISAIDSGLQTFTTPNNCHFMRFSYRNESTNIQLEVGSTATAFEPYKGRGVIADGTPEVLTVSATGAEPQIVTDIPMLLSVGDITDEKDIISGGVTHRIGCHVFDGTETFSKSSAYGKAFLLNAAYAAWGADKTKAVLCTHFLGLPQKSSAQNDNTCFFNSTGHFYFRVTDNSDTDAFKAWLAEQYASGAPVIVWFVLAENVTESVTAQPLHTADGDNTVSVTANVSPVALECEYANGYAQ